MTVSFQIQHSAMLLKYSGISFISGAVNHGFFSGERSLWTAAVGIVLFVAGAWMEHRSQNNTQSLIESLWVGTLLSIGLGFFTAALSGLTCTQRLGSAFGFCHFYISPAVHAQNAHAARIACLLFEPRACSLCQQLGRL
jgi:hypothetical protein